MSQIGELHRGEKGAETEEQGGSYRMLSAFQFSAIAGGTPGRLDGNSLVWTNYSGKKIAILRQEADGKIILSRPKSEYRDLEVQDYAAFLGDEEDFVLVAPNPDMVEYIEISGPVAGTHSFTEEKFVRCRFDSVHPNLLRARELALEMRRQRQAASAAVVGPATD
jgi:hypothetical protein